MFLPNQALFLKKTPIIISEIDCIASRQREKFLTATADMQLPTCLPSFLRLPSSFLRIAAGFRTITDNYPQREGVGGKRSGGMAEKVEGEKRSSRRRRLCCFEKSFFCSIDTKEGEKGPLSQTHARGGGGGEGIIHSAVPLFSVVVVVVTFKGRPRQKRRGKIERKGISSFAGRFIPLLLPLS